MKQTPIGVIVHGALGKMGQTILNALSKAPDFCLAGAVDLRAEADTLTLPGKPDSIPLADSLDKMLDRVHADVVVDFSVATATMVAVKVAAPRGINLVIGTTGLSSDDIAEIEGLVAQSNIGIVIAPNFSLGAVLMMHLAKQAAQYYNYAEIIEMHHSDKKDAPSGTALATARAMLGARGSEFEAATEPATITSSRGDLWGGLRIHSVRLPGIMADQKVILGSTGETLTIEHEAINRDCYLPGIILAIREVTIRKGLIKGLEALLGLQ